MLIAEDRTIASLFFGQNTGIWRAYGWTDSPWILQQSALRAIPLLRVTLEGPKWYHWILWVCFSI